MDEAVLAGLRGDRAWLEEHAAEAMRVRPNALRQLDADESWDLPFRGIGSPHSVAMTLFRGGEGTQERIVYAGTTPDATLNAHLLVGLFAAALACDEESFVTAAGGVLRLGAGQVSLADAERPVVLLAALGISGAVEPFANVATAGLGAAEAMHMALNLLRALEESSGLVAITDWEVANADEFDKRLRDSIADPAIAPPAATASAGSHRPQNVSAEYDLSSTAWNDIHWPREQSRTKIAQPVVVIHRRPTKKAANTVATPNSAGIARRAISDGPRTSRTSRCSASQARGAL